jgi:hypothetical protein
MYRQTSIRRGSHLRSLAGAAALGILLTSASPAAANLGPRGTVSRLKGCIQMSGYPNCHPGRPYMYQGRSVAISQPRGGRPADAGGWGYNHYTYGPNCLRYGYPPNCPYWELPDWNGGMEIKNPGGG